MPLWEIGVLFLSVMIASYLLSLRMGKTSAAYLRLKQIPAEDKPMHGFGVISGVCSPFMVFALLRMGPGYKDLLLLLMLCVFASSAMGYYQGKRIAERGK